MSSFFSLQKRNTCKVGVVCAILTWLVIQFSVAAIHTFAVEETGQAKAILHNSVAILPFENLSPNPDEAYFAVGIHQEILNHLAKLRDLSATSRSSVSRYEDSNQSISEIASELNVENIMKGNVRYANNQITLTVQLFDVSNNIPLWSEVYIGDLSDIFAVQAEVVKRIALILSAEVTPAEQERIEKVPTQSLEAYTLYLKAMTFVQTPLNPIMPSMFYQYLDQAIALDPDFALAHAVKASSYGLTLSPGIQINGFTLDEMERVAIEHTKEALELDPNLGMAHWAQALIHFNNQRGMETMQAYDRALKLRPNDARILDEYVRFLTYVGGKNEEAVRITRRAITLVPNDIGRYGRFARTLMFAGQPVEAAVYFRKSVELSPSVHWVHLWLGMIEIILGNDTEALKQLQLTEEQLTDKYEPFSISRLAYFYSRLGLQEDAKRLTKRIERWAADGLHIRISTLALSYLAIGEYDKAYDVLSQNPNQGISSLQEIKSNIMNDPVLEEPRFIELRNMIGSFD